ncbi:TBC1 domain family member 8B-like [Impatiens glandulifera]|uniref:TBC1 domain family member 8B-like n=1 Tax=Impatiens glandulifera TaxID=253017 RepID=UPI001FB067F8|nr:TBC1 domain family member 8B-like [Impatiens glandulifera]
MKVKSSGTAAVLFPPLVTFEQKRDAYGFAVRPQHVQRYREYATIYKEEEEERSDRWGNFLERQEDPATGLQEGKVQNAVEQVASMQTKGTNMEKGVEANGICEKKTSDGELVEDVSKADMKTHRVQIWTDIRPSLLTIEDIMSVRVKKINIANEEQHNVFENPLPPISEAKSMKGASEEDSEDEFYDVEKSDSNQDSPSSDSLYARSQGAADGFHSPQYLSPWREELECLIQGGVPMSLRGELWQTFVGVKTRRVEKYYQDLLVPESKPINCVEHAEADHDKMSTIESTPMPEKWKCQIEKDLPRTFPGHPALDEDGRNALRRLLTAYARHNPSVGYCQAMNFFAGLLLLLMPEENAFWTLMGIIDDYFEGYYSEEMIESQVDQLVLEELVRERFPKLVHHLDYLGVQIAWVTGPWFLSIFMNVLPWECVLRIWDVLLFEGNRVILFRITLALMELYGPALVTTKDAGDAVTLLQSMAGSTFDSSQLVLTACMGYQNVNESRLNELRNNHRPAVRATLEERSKGLQAWRDSQGLASKLYSFKHNPGSLMIETKETDLLSDKDTSGINHTVTGNSDINSVPDLQEQVMSLKIELHKFLEEKRSAVLRAEELETALMEMVKQDNRRQLSAKVELLEREVVALRQALVDKQEQENAMLQVLMRVEQEQRVTEDARIYAEQEATSQKYAAQVLQEKYEEVTARLSEMEERVVMAESMLEATLQYQSGQSKALPSPRSMQQETSTIRSSQEFEPVRKISLLSRPFGLSWRDKTKEKATDNAEDLPEGESSSPVITQKKKVDSNDVQANE